MEIAERIKLVNRICSSKLFSVVEFKNKLVKVCFSDPKIDLLTEADFIYSTAYDESVDDGVMTLDESIKVLKEDGEWSDSLENEIAVLSKNNEQLQEQLGQFKFHKSNQKLIKQTIKKNEDRLDELSIKRNQLFTSTAEFFAEMAKKRFLIRNSAKVDDESLLSNKSFIDLLIVCYYRKNSVSNSQVRELARSDPWRTYWTVSKQTGTSLFPHSCVEMTEYQYALVSWSRVYDFAYESDNRPTDDVIDDDDKFDGWYKSEVDRILGEIRKNQSNLGGKDFGSNAVGRSEVFIPADYEGAKEVYALNDPISRNNIQKRQKVLETKIVCREDEMPDTKQEIKMGLNKLAMERGKS